MEEERAMEEEEEEEEVRCFLEGLGVPASEGEAV